MPIIHALTNEEVTDRERRRSLFSGNLFVYSPRPSTVAFAAAARVIIDQMLGPEPSMAQERMSEAEFTALFNSASRSLSAIVLPLASAVVADFGCDPHTTFVGAPSLVGGTGMGFVAHGLGVPQHPHRDTWYAASPCQLNWWIPLYDLEAGACFAFHPAYWDMPVHNTSRHFDYEEWYETTRMGMNIEPLSQPRPLDPIDLTPEIRISCPAGGVILSSVAQLYSTVPNETVKTHFSIHFKSVSETDIETGEGPYNLDAEPQGTSLASFVRCSNFSPIPESLVRLDHERRRAGLARRHPASEMRGRPAG